MKKSLLLIVLAVVPMLIKAQSKEAKSACDLMNQEAQRILANKPNTTQKCQILVLLKAQETLRARYPDAGIIDKSTQVNEWKSLLNNSCDCSNNAGDFNKHPDKLIIATSNGGVKTHKVVDAFDYMVSMLTKEQMSEFLEQLVPDDRVKVDKYLQKNNQDINNYKDLNGSMHLQYGNDNKIFNDNIQFEKDNLKQIDMQKLQKQLDADKLQQKE